MGDQLGPVEKRLDDMRQELAALRREVADVVARSFKWTIVILAFAVVVTWFGVFIILRGSGGMMRRMMPF